MPFIEVPEKIQRMMEIMEASGHEVERHEQIFYGTCVNCKTYH